MRVKNLTVLIWLTQLGLSVALPLAGFVLLALWLQNNCGWGQWVIYAGFGIGLVFAIDGLRTSLKAMDRVGKKDQSSPPIGFDDHH